MSATAKPVARGNAWTVALGRWRVWRNHWPMILATTLGTPLFYVLGLGRGLGTSVPTMGQGAAGPVGYVDYIAPALLVSAVIAVAMTEWTYPIVDGFQWRKHFHPLAATPLTPGQIAHGVILAGIGRMLLVGVVYALVLWGSGHLGSPWGLVTLPLLGLAGGLSFGLLILAFACALRRENGLLSNVTRLIYLPMTLFSAVFFPLSALPGWLQWIGWISPLWHAAELGRVAAFGQPTTSALLVWHIAYLAALAVLGWWGTRVCCRVKLHTVGWFYYLPPRLERLADQALAATWSVMEKVIYPGSHIVAPHSDDEGLPQFLHEPDPPRRPSRWRGPANVIRRNLVATKHFAWMPVLTGFFEPVLYLWSMGLGLGGYMGSLAVGDHAVPYAAFIAPALLATSAMNGAVYDSTSNVFYKLHQAKTYRGMLATSLRPGDIAVGEIGYALLRGLVYAVGFFVVAFGFDLALSWWAVLAIPAATLVAFGFAGLGMAITSFLSTVQQLDWIRFTTLPMFLLSGVFFPVTALPEAVRWVVEVFPLWHAVELIRGLMLGDVGWGILGHTAYFAALALVGSILVSWRIRALFSD